MSFPGVGPAGPSSWTAYQLERFLERCIAGTCMQVCRAAMRTLLAVFKDLIPARRISPVMGETPDEVSCSDNGGRQTLICRCKFPSCQRGALHPGSVPPTLCMQLSKEARALQAYEAALLDSCNAFLEALLRVSGTGAGFAAQLMRLWLHQELQLCHHLAGKKRMLVWLAPADTGGLGRLPCHYKTGLRGCRVRGRAAGRRATSQLPFWWAGSAYVLLLCINLTFIYLYLSRSCFAHVSDCPIAMQICFKRLSCTCL